MKNLLKNNNGNSILIIIWSVILGIISSVLFYRIVLMYEDMGITADEMFKFKPSDIALLIVSGIFIAFIYKKESKRKSNIICSLLIITWVLLFILGSLVMRLYTGSFLFDSYGM